MSDDYDQEAITNPVFPNAARIYDYTLGGSNNFEADRQAAEYMFSLLPSTRKWVRMLRDFLQKSAKVLHQDGFTHFVDFASGLPTQDHIHHVLPQAKIIYSDIDRMTLDRGQEMVQDLPNVSYFKCDIHDAKKFLQDPEVTKFLDGKRKVAFGLNGVTSFLAPDEIRKMLNDLYQWAETGSRLCITFETKEPEQITPKLQQFLDMFKNTGSPFHLFSYQECLELIAPWKLDTKGLVPLREFLELPENHITEEDREGVGLEFYAAILEK